MKSCATGWFDDTRYSTVAGLLAAAAMAMGCASNTGEDAVQAQEGVRSGQALGVVAERHGSFVNISGIPASITSSSVSLRVVNQPRGMVVGQGPLVAGSWLRASVAGLPPGASYDAYLHVGGCANGGGERYLHIDPGAPNQPPMEQLMRVQVDDNGQGLGSRNLRGHASAEARSVVMHHNVPQADGNLPKFLCADLARQ